MRLEPLAVYVLDCFRSKKTDALPFSRIAEDCTERRRSALKETVEHLREQRLLTDSVTEGQQLLELTEEGRSYLALAHAESTDHFVP